MAMKLYQAVPGVFSLETNVIYIPGFQFASHLFPIQTYLKPLFHVRYEVGKWSINSHQPHFHIAGVNPNTDEVWLHYGNKLVSFSFKSKGLKSDCLEVLVSKQYALLYRNRIEVLYPPGAYLTDLVTVMLLQRNLSPIHCSCIEIDGKSYLMTAPAGTGKTLTALRLLQHCPDARIMSDDIVITDGFQVWGCPLTASVEYDLKELGVKGLSWWRHMLLNLMPLLYPFVVKSIRPLIVQLGEKRISFKAPAGALFFLERGSPSWRKIESNDGLRMLIAINRLEFTYMRNVLISAYSFYDPSFSLLALSEQEETILHRLLENVPAYVITSAHPDDFWKVILRILERHG